MFKLLFKNVEFCEFSCLYAIFIIMAYWNDYFPLLNCHNILVKNHLTMWDGVSLFWSLLFLSYVSMALVIMTMTLSNKIRQLRHPPFFCLFSKFFLLLLGPLLSYMMDYLSDLYPQTFKILNISTAFLDKHLVMVCLHIDGLYLLVFWWKVLHVWLHR